uniref:Cytochrome P450 n=1 Tax=Kalanchoe fedtschenkoi TaxID=63787 RepID=A0A7N0TC92_KALFE
MMCTYPSYKCVFELIIHVREKKNQSMETFHVALAGLFGLAGLFILLSKRRSVPPKRESPPPEAGQAWPLIGHLHTMARSNAPRKTLGAMADRYGPMFAIRLGFQRVVVVSNSKLAKECFAANDVAISSRPKSVALDHLSYNYASFGFAPYGPYWRELRKIATLELLSSKRIKLLKHVRISETRSSVSELYQSFRAADVRQGSAADDASVKVVEMKEWFGKLTLNIMLQVVVGRKHVGSLNDFTDVGMYRKSTMEGFHLLGLFLVADAFPFLRWLDAGGHEKKMKATAAELDRIASKWLEKHKQKTVSTGDGVKLDFMAVLLDLLEDTHVAGFDADTVNKATCFAMIAGGNDTTTVTLVWTLCLLLNNREALRKVQEEIDYHVGRERLVDESDTNSLAYLRAVVKESMRLYPAAPLASYREVREDCTIGGYHVAKGTHLIVNLWKIHHDPDVWADPSEFRPERFVSGGHEEDVVGPHFELLPFGGGRRACPGAALALEIVHLVLATFLQAFDVRSASDGVVDMSESLGLTTVKATPLQVLVTPRLPLQLYE